MADIGQFISTYLGLKNYQLEQQRVQAQVAQSKAQTQLAQLGDFRQALGTTENPAMQEALVKFYSKASGTPEDVLRSLATSTPASTEVTRAASVQRGVAATKGTSAGAQQDKAAGSVATTGALPGQVASSDYLAQLFGTAAGIAPSAEQMGQFVSRQVTGMDTGAAALSSATAGQSPNVLNQAAQVALGTRMSAAQIAQHQLGLGNLAVSQGQLGVAQAGARLGQGQLALQASQYGAENTLRSQAIDVDRIKAMAAAAGKDPQHAVDLSAQKVKLLNDMQTLYTKNQLNATSAQSYANALTAINQLLQRAGVANEGVVTPEQILHPNGPPGSVNWWFGNSQKPMIGSHPQP